MAEWRVYSNEELEEAKERSKKRELKNKIKQTFNDGVMWVEQHKETLIVATPLLLGAGKVVSKIGKAANKKADLNKEKDLKELYCYDRSLGHYWKLRRKLTNSEWTTIENRKKNGERLSDILNDMRVLE